MVTIVTMDGKRFQRLATALPVRHRSEKEWFAADNEARIGAVVYDLVDSDWSFVALTRQPDNEDVPYIVFDLGVSFKTATEAREALHKALQSDGSVSAAQTECLEIMERMGGREKCIEISQEVFKGWRPPRHRKGTA